MPQTPEIKKEKDQAGRPLLSFRLASARRNPNQSSSTGGSRLNLHNQKRVSAKRSRAGMVASFNLLSFADDLGLSTCKQPDKNAVASAKDKNKSRQNIIAPIGNNEMNTQSDQNVAGPVINSALLRITKPPVLSPAPGINCHTYYLSSLLRTRQLLLNLEAPVADNDMPIKRVNERLVSDGGLVMSEMLRSSSNLPVLSLPPAVEMNNGIGYLTENQSTGQVPNVIRLNVQGALLEHVWAELTASKKYDYIVQLRSIVKHMRGIAPACPDGAFRIIGSALSSGFSLLIDSGPAKAGWVVRFKPTQETFVAFLAATLNPKVPKLLAATIAYQFNTTGGLVLTHADLSPRNIIVANNKIIAITGWDSAGWYPLWWEYVKFFDATTAPVNHDWYDYAHEIFETTHPNELMAYQALARGRAGMP